MASGEPGWYEQPDGRVRFWNGTGWVGDPVAPPTFPPPPSRSATAFPAPPPPSYAQPAASPAPPVQEPSQEDTAGTSSQGVSRDTGEKILTVLVGVPLVVLFLAGWLGTAVALFADGTRGWALITLFIPPVAAFTGWMVSTLWGVLGVVSAILVVVFTVMGNL